MNFNEGVVSIATLHDKITKQLYKIAPVSIQYSWNKKAS
jgi:hypothetical protein